MQGRQYRQQRQHELVVIYLNRTGSEGIYELISSGGENYSSSESASIFHSCFAASISVSEMFMT